MTATTEELQAIASARVLNVDDDLPSLYAKTRVLRKAGFRVLEATRGLQALDIVRAEHPEVVLLDVHLPDVSGLEVCSRIKGDPATASTLVLQVSASYTERDDRVRGLNAGADSYLTEPVEPEELIANLRALLRLRHAEGEVRRAGLEWQATFAAARDGLAILDQDARIRRCNRAFESLVGLQVGASLAERIGSDEKVRDLISRAAAGGGSFCEAVLGDRWIRFTFDAIPDGTAGTIVCGAADITSEHRLREAHERVSNVLDSITEAQYVVDREWRFTSMNRMAEQIFGRPFEELAGKQLWDEFPATVDGVARPAFEQAFATGEPVHFEAKSVLLEKWFEVHAYPRRSHLEIFLHDVTDRKMLEEQLRASKEQAEAGSRAKDEFLATVSHELRTPMTSIVGWAQMLETYQSSDETIRTAAAAIVHSARMQSKLVDDMLDTARIISGKLRLELLPCNFADAVQAAIGSLIPLVRAKDLELETSIVPARVIGDHSRLQQIAWNLLSNAVKFTPPQGRVSVSLSVSGSRAILRVSDTGRGIEQAFLPSVFDRFTQAAGGEDGGSGLGLGLSIVRHIAELHGGEVDATSEGPGRGATFSVSLPLLQ